MHRQFLLFFFSLMVLSALGQTGFISISAHGPILTSKQQDTRYYRDEIKIDIKTGEVYFRNKSTRRFRPIRKLKNDSTVLLLKKINYIMFDSVVKKNFYKAEVSFKIEFTHAGLSGSPILTNILEFGYPVGDNKYLEDLIKCYYILKSKIKT